jgi:hypothetical protein
MKNNNPKYQKLTYITGILKSNNTSIYKRIYYCHREGICIRDEDLNYISNKNIPKKLEKILLISLVKII